MRGTGYFCQDVLNEEFLLVFSGSCFKAGGRTLTEYTKQQTDTKGKGAEVLTFCLIHETDIDAILRTEN